MNILDDVLKRNEDVAWRIIEGEALVINPKDSMTYPLNPVGSRIWELLDGRRSGKEIAGIIDEEFEGNKLAMEQDVAEFLKKLLDKGLAQICEVIK